MFVISTHPLPPQEKGTLIEADADEVPKVSNTFGNRSSNSAVSCVITYGPVRSNYLWILRSSKLLCAFNRFV